MPAQASAQPARTRNLVRTVDLVAELSLDIDAASGAGSGHALRTCFLAVRAAEALGMADRERSALFYARFSTMSARIGPTTLTPPCQPGDD